MQMKSSTLTLLFCFFACAQAATFLAGQKQEQRKPTFTFGAFDRNGDKQIVLDEALHYLKDIVHDDVSPEKISKTFKDADTNKDNVVSQKEFEVAVRKHATSFLQMSTEPGQEEFKFKFDAIDGIGGNGDKQIVLPEFIHYMKDIVHADYSTTKLTNMFEEADTNKDKIVSHKEFDDIVLHKKVSFGDIDSNGDKLIGLDELVHYVKDIAHQDARFEEFRQKFQEVDTNKDKVVSQEEFAEAVRKDANNF